MSNQRIEISPWEDHSIVFDLLSITKARYDTDWHSILHTHPFTEILYVSEGEGFFYHEAQAIPVKKKDLIIINPQVEHTESSSKENPLGYYSLAISGINFLNRTTQAPFTLMNIKNQEGLSSYMKLIFEEAKSNLPDSSFICYNLCESFLIKVKQLNDFHIEAEDRKALYSKEIAKVKSYLDNTYHEPITLKELADLSHLSISYLSHTFRKEIGVPPIDYLNHIRIQRAKELLETTNHSIGEIATSVGFSSHSYFGSLFKRIIGQTPSVYRDHFKTSQKNK